MEVDNKGLLKYPLRIIVAGGRKFDDYLAVCIKLDMLLRNTDKGDIVILCGEATGADTLGKKYAISRGIDWASFPAPWKDLTTEPVLIRENSYGQYNVLAGIVRNHQMGDVATHAVIWWNGKSTGSKDMIDYATKKGLVVRVCKY